MLSRDQFSIFGGRAGGDEEASALGRATASYRRAMADSIISKTGEGPYGHPDTYREVLERRNLTHQDRLALETRPPSEVRDAPFLHHNRVGEYDPYEQSIRVQTPSSRGSSKWHEDVNTMAHELGHHIHYAYSSKDQRQRESTFLEIDPVREGVADGFADRVVGGKPTDRTYYGDYFNDAESLPDDIDSSPHFGPGEPMMFYTRARNRAFNGEWPKMVEPRDRSEQLRLF